MIKMEFELNKKRILILIIAIQLATSGIIGIEKLGMKLFPLRQMIIFIYLTIIPGILIIGFLRLLSKLSIIEIVLYSVGLSNSFLMIIGLIMNSICPIFGILKPISELSLITTIGICNLILWGLYLIRGDTFTKYIKVNYLRRPHLFLILLPFLSIFGAYSLTYYNSNISLLFMFAIISIIPTLAILKFPEDFYPLVLWVISISLLFQTSLVSTVVPNGGDAAIEYYYSKLVLSNNMWNYSIPSNDNSMLRIVVLHPIFSILLGISLTWEYKIVHSLIFSLAPVALYLIYKKQTNSKIGFLSSCLFMFIFPFFTTLAMNTRTGMAILYMALIILLMVSNNVPRNIKVILYVLFSFSLITSHYGTAWLFMLALPILYILILIFNHLNDRLEFSEFLSFGLVAIYLIMAISWYMHTSRANIFQDFTHSMYIILKNALTSLGFDVKTSYTVFVIVKEWVPTIEIIKYLFSFTILLSIIGILGIAWECIKLRKSYNFYVEYMFLSVLFLGMFLSTLLPQTRSAAPIRIYTLSMIFLSPFCVIGFIKLSKKSIIFKRDHSPLLIFSIYLSILILFNSGFFSELFIKDYSPNILIHKKKLTEKEIPPSEIDNRIITFYRWYFPECDVLSAKWLSERGEHTYRVYTQLGGLEDALNAYGSYQIRDQRFINFPTVPSIKPKEKSYVYLKYLNYVQGIIISDIYPEIKWYSIRLLNLNEKGDKVYCNGGSAIYYIKPRGGSI